MLPPIRSSIRTISAKTSDGRLLRRVISVDATPPSFPQKYMIAIYLLVTEDQSTGKRSAALIDTSCGNGVPDIVQQALADEGCSPESVNAIYLTHQHLDHASQGSALLNVLPNAKIVTHPGVAPHIIDPSKLIAGAKQVYPPEAFETQVGSMAPIPAERVIAVKEEQNKTREGVTTATAPTDDTIKLLFTQGHAKNHTVFYDTITKSCFTGDSFSMRYPHFFGENSAFNDFVFPTTSPIDFDYKEAMKALDNICALPELQHIFPTHFGVISGLDSEIADAKWQSQELLGVTEGLRGDAMALLAEGKSSKYTTESVGERLFQEYEIHAEKRSKKSGGLLDPSVGCEAALKFLSGSCGINAQGIVVAAARELKKKKN